MKLKTLKIYGKKYSKKMTIGYAKFNRGIIATIETDDYTQISDEVINLDTCAYMTTKFKILELEFVTDQIINSTTISFDGIQTLLNHNYSVEIKYDILLEVGNTYVSLPIKFYKLKNIAFMCDFFACKEWEFFTNGYSGYFEGYNINGVLECKCLHTNGEIHSFEGDESSRYNYNLFIL